MPIKVGVDAAPFKAVFEKKKASGKSAKAAMTFPGGTHDLWIRHWLAAGGIDPDKDVETITVPPPQMVANMKVGTMDAFCVGEPWPGQLVHQGIGYTAINTGEIWSKHPEKSLGMRAAWVDKNPKAAKAILMAVMEAQQADKMENKDELATIMGKRQWINCPVEDIADRAKGKFNYGIPGKVVENSPHIMKFWRDPRLYPFQSHDLWFMTEDIRWGNIEGLRQQGADRQGQPRGYVARRGQGAGRRCCRHSGLDLARQGDLLRRQGVRPENPAAYLKSLSIKRVDVRSSPPRVKQRAARLFEHGDTISMSMHAIKVEATAVAIPTASPTAAAPVVTMTPKQAPRAEKYIKMAKETAVRVVPPLVVLALLMLFWELVCRRAGSTRRRRASSRKPRN